MAHSFFGGVHPDDRKQLACDCPIGPYVPRQVVIPMSQHIGAPCQPLVKKGDTVTVGQKIGDNTGLCVPVHASVSGTVAAVELRPHTSGVPVMSVVIDSDGLDTPCPDLTPHETLDGLTAEELMDIIHEAGIAGMGGATFPAHVKLSSGIGKVDTLILNASECEPYITADDRLLRETPERVVGGLRVLMRIFALDRAYIGIEDNKPEAIRSLQNLLGSGSDIELCVRRTRYPQGAEKQLIQSITGRLVPPGGLPAAVGCAVFNAATAAAVYDAVYLGRPLTHRVVTVTGEAVKRPGNYLVPIGTRFSDLIEASGGFKTPAYKVLSGGPMMGMAQAGLDVPVSKGTNAITCLDDTAWKGEKTPHCIRCGRCMDACPMHLMPLYLYKYERADNLEGLTKKNVTDCIECGCCAYVCPAGIPLVQSFKNAKQKLRDAAAKK